jgi:large subunit ribosomal protein L2
VVDFKRTKFAMSATVERIEYDPNRTAFIALVKYEDGELSYILAPQRLAVGDKWSPATSVDVKPGNAMPLSSMPVGTIIHNVEMKPARVVRLHVPPVPMHSSLAATRVTWRLPAFRRASSVASRDLPGFVGARVEPGPHEHQSGKAGRSRWLGRRPHVRGVAMNPVDHPHGGGEGRTSGGRHPVTPWGKPTKGKRTRSNKSTDKYIVRSRHQRKK